MGIAEQLIDVGPKRELRTTLVLAPPSPEVLTWID